MKRFLIAAVCFGVMGGAVAGFTEEEASPSFKGTELYSWEADNDWYFSLLIGTNRLKSDDEITSGAVRGVDAIKEQLSQLGKGEFVLWSGFRTKPYYSDKIREEIESYCKQLGLELSVDGDWYMKTRLLER